MADKTISQQDVNSLATKLKAFSEGLPAQEQGVLDWMLARAHNASELELSDRSLEDVAGGGDTIGATWSHSFQSAAPESNE
jgi:hypothetical protein